MKQNNQYQNPVELGRSLEGRVVKALNKRGYALVEKNQWNKNNHPYRDFAVRREYDVVMYNHQNRQYYIIECKSHFNPDNDVGLGEVKEFDHKLNNYNGFNVVRLMVSDTGYSERAKRYAEHHKMILVNGEELSALEQKNSNLEEIITLAKGAITNSLVKESLRIIKGLFKTGGG